MYTFIFFKKKNLFRGVSRQAYLNLTFFANAQIINLCYQTPRGEMLTVVCTAIMLAQDQPVAWSCDRVPR